MSGGGTITSKGGAKISLYIFAGLNISIRALLVLFILFESYELVGTLIWLLAGAIPIAWGIYFSIFGLRAAQNFDYYENGKQLFNIIYYIIIIILIVANILGLMAVFTCSGYGCMGIVFILPPLWIDLTLQLGIGISIFKLYKDKSQ